VNLGYYERVLDHLMPTDRPYAVVELSVVVHPGWGTPYKLVLRAGGGTFEFFKGTFSGDLYQFLYDLEGSCQVPGTPEEAANLVKIRWEEIPLTQAQFEQRLRDFTSASSEYIADVQEKASAIAASGTYAESVHLTRYNVLYRDGRHEIEIRTHTLDPDKPDPMVKWARAFAKLSDESFGAGVPSVSGGRPSAESRSIPTTPELPTSAPAAGAQPSERK
jgi:hypothetical protein